MAVNDDIWAKSNNFLAAVHFGRTITGVAFLDVSTGEFILAQGQEDYIDKLLQNFKPSEVLSAKPKRKVFSEAFGDEFHNFYLEDWIFQDDYANECLLKQFQTNSLKGFGIEGMYEGIVAAGAILHYLADAQHQNLKHISSIKRLHEGAFVWMDKFTIKNLELYQSPHYNAVTLIDVIDYTKSAMGSRLLKRWLALPLVNQKEIEKRHDMVSYFYESQEVLSKVQSYINSICDIERLISKVATYKISPKEIILLKNALEVIEPVKQLLSQSGNKALQQLGEALDNCEALRARIKATLNEDAPVNILKGNAIASSFSKELEELRGLAFRVRITLIKCWSASLRLQNSS